MSRVGLDGQWIGATSGDTFFGFAVSPGPHHLCSSWQGHAKVAIMGVGGSPFQSDGALSFTAEPNVVYYFASTDFDGDDEKRPLPPELKLTQLNDDQGQLLVEHRKLAIASKKN